MTVRTRFFACIFVIFSCFKKSEKARPRKSQWLSNAALKMACQNSTTHIRTKKKQKKTPGILVVKSRGTLARKKKNPSSPSPSARSARFRGVFGCRTIDKFITPRKSVPWCWGKLDIFGCTDYTYSSILTRSIYYVVCTILLFFERSEFLIDTSQKKSLHVCRVPCAVCTCARVQ